jgi:molybdate transport system substrate-binding protein
MKAAAVCVLALIAGVGPGPVGAQASRRDVLIFAASSLQTALDELAEPVRRATGIGIKVSYASSSALARQIVEGAPADVFISADLDWMDYVAERKLIRLESRVNLLGNRLVLIAPRDRPVKLGITRSFALAAALGTGRLALADPAAVPAGKYARAALTSLGVWDSVASRIAAAENVRAALLLVSRGEAALGVVYFTDAMADTGVTIVDTFPATTHPAIVYPAALLSTSTPEGARVLDFLKSDTAWPAFAKQGFTKPAQR